MGRSGGRMSAGSASNGKNRTQEIAALLTGIVRLLARWSDDPEFGRSRLSAVAATYGITPHGYGSDWRYADNSWVCLPALAAVLRSAPGIRSAEVFTEAGMVVAHVTDPQGAHTANSLREHVLAATTDRFDLIAPHRYVLCGGYTVTSSLS